LVRTLLSLGLLLALAGLIALSAARYLQVDEVTIPDVLGQEATRATRALKELGFTVSTYTETVPDALAGGVVSQTPEAGTAVRRGRSVSLGIGAAERGDVPNVVGSPQEDAEAQLAEAGLTVTELRYRYAPEAAGTVLEQLPAAGSVADSGSTASLVVSRGPEPPTVAVPNLVGRRAARAREELQALGFRRVEVIPSRLGPPGVHAQVPSAGEQVPLSTQITLYTSVSNPQVVRVPPVVGLPLEVAARRLSAAGLRVGPLETTLDPSRPRGVTAVAPRDYTLWGSPVALTVNGEVTAFEAPEPAPPRLRGPLAAQDLPAGNAAGAAPQTQADTPSQPAPTTVPIGGRAIPIEYDPANYGFLRGRAYTFRVEITDDQGERVAIDRQMDADEPVSDTVVVFGEAELRMYIDGQIVLAYNPPNP
jgi:beta-lactam-binding protein with PASTA domain